MIGPLGDIQPGSPAITGQFNTHDPDTGEKITLSGSPAVVVYRDDSTTPISTGVSLDVDFNSVTGLHLVTIDHSDAAYTAGSNFRIVLSEGMAGSVDVSGTVLGTFSKAARPATLIDNAITAAKIATNAITSNELAASAVSAIQSGLATTEDVEGIEADISAEDIRAAVGLESANLDAQLEAKLATTHFDARVGDTGEFGEYDHLADMLFNTRTTVLNATTNLFTEVGQVQNALNTELPGSVGELIAQTHSTVGDIEAGSVPPRDLLPVQHTWHLVRSGAKSFLSTNDITVTPGTVMRVGWNCDLPAILPPGTVIKSMGDVFSSSSADVGIEKTDGSSHGEKVAKAVLTVAENALPGVYWMRTTITNSSNDGPVPVFGKVTVVAEPEATPE